MAGQNGGRVRPVPRRSAARIARLIHVLAAAALPRFWVTGRLTTCHRHVKRRLTAQPPGSRAAVASDGEIGLWVWELISRSLRRGRVPRRRLRPLAPVSQCVSPRPFSGRSLSSLLLRHSWNRSSSQAGAKSRASDGPSPNSPPVFRKRSGPSRGWHLALARRYRIPPGCHRTMRDQGHEPPIALEPRRRLRWCAQCGCSERPLATALG